MTATLVTTAEELTSDWLGTVLGCFVTNLSVQRVGTGQIGTCYQLGGDVNGEQRRFIAKLPVADPNLRQLLSIPYRKEIKFYTQIASTIAMRFPRCYFAQISEDGSAFTLLLEDLSPATAGDQTQSLTYERAQDAVLNLVGLHASRWCDSSLLDIDGLSLNTDSEAEAIVGPYADCTRIFLDKFGSRLTQDDSDTLRQCAEIVRPWLAGQHERFGLVHGDYRPDNLLFPPEGGRGVWTVDWQTLTLGLPARDLAFFIASSFALDERRGYERGLVAQYHQSMLDSGVDNYTFEECWRDYCFGMMHGVMTAVFASAYAHPTERGDRMFVTMATQSCAAIRDLNTIGITLC